MPSISATRTLRPPLGRRDPTLRMPRRSAQFRNITGPDDDAGVPANAVRFRVDALARIGRVEQLVDKTVDHGCPPGLYRAIRRRDPNGPTHDWLLTHIPTTSLNTAADDPSSVANKLGHLGGPVMVEHHCPSAPSTTRSIGKLTDVRHDRGLTPELSACRIALIRLRHCAFYDPVETYGAPIGALCHGPMRGVLAALRAPVTVSRLDAFLEPDLRVARLSSVPAPAVRGRRYRRSAGGRHMTPNPATRA
ncbi:MULTISPECIES: transcriptional regulator [Mycobacterium ulcerans group]|nr:MULTISPECIES: transcriptional regulator [Mycobacterium ulcerans group]